MIKSTVLVTHTYRFRAVAAAIDTPITDQTLIGAMGVIATAATTAAPLYETVKVNRIKMWASSADASFCTVSCNFEGSPNATNNLRPNLEYSDSTVSSAHPAHINVTPPKNSICSFWNSFFGNVLFNLTCPANTIIDVTLTGIQRDETGTTGLTLVGATAGSLYYLALDGYTPNNFRPVSLASI